MRKLLPILLILTLAAARRPVDKFPHKTVEMPAPAKKVVSPMPQAVLSVAGVSVVPTKTQSRPERTAAVLAVIKPILKPWPKPAISIRFDGPTNGHARLRMGYSSGQWFATNDFTGNTVTVTNLDVHRPAVFNVAAVATNGLESGILTQTEVYWNCPAQGIAWVDTAAHFAYPIATGQTATIATSQDLIKWSNIATNRATSNCVQTLDLPAKGHDFVRVTRN